ncbi:ATP-binding protein [Afifella pfennigii]|uniref:ATP-binding protein n=1 Tax=Afifella pfennigii TaxID=209897 RepID=UPI0006918AA0|nr:ATP-binding protein [Afifella pfennigii]
MQAGTERLIEWMSEEELARLVGEARPAFLFRLADARLAWANPAAGRRLARSSLAQVLGLGLGGADPLRQDIRSLARTAGERVSLGRLRLNRGFGAVPEMCECRRLTLAGQRFLLALAARPERAPTPQEAASFFAGGAVAARLAPFSPPEAARLEEAGAARPVSLSGGWPGAGRLRRAVLLRLGERDLVLIDLASDLGPAEALGAAQKQESRPAEAEPAAPLPQALAVESPANDDAAAKAGEAAVADAQAPAEPEAPAAPHALADEAEAGSPGEEAVRKEAASETTADAFDEEAFDEEALDEKALDEEAGRQEPHAPPPSEEEARRSSAENDLTEAVRRALPAWIAERLTTYEPHADAQAATGEEGAPAAPAEPDEPAGETDDASPALEDAPAGEGEEEAPREEEALPAGEARTPDEIARAADETAEADEKTAPPPNTPQPSVSEARPGEAGPGEEREAAEPPADEATPPVPAKGQGNAERASEARASEAPPAPSKEDGAPRTAKALPPVSVRFLWQTDAAHRILFVSQGLNQLVGRNAEIVGESFQDAAARLRLDPTGRIAKAFAARDTWSGLTAWWPSPDGRTRIPAELTALPVFDADRGFQGFRGFGVLRPAEALKAEAFDLRFPPPDNGAGPGEPPTSGQEDNVVPFRSDQERLSEFASLSPQEKRAFEAIASALGARVSDFTPSTGTPAGDRRPLPQAEPAEGKEPSQEAAPVSQEQPLTEEEEPTPEEGAPEEAGPEEAGPEEAAAAAIEPLLPEEAPERAFPPSGEEPPVFKEPEPAAPAELGQERRPLPSAAFLAAKVGELEAIVDTALDGVIVLDGEGRIESVNSSAEALLGIEEEEVVGEPFRVLLEEESRETAEAYLESLKSAGIRSLINEGREVLGRAGGGPIALFMTFGQVGTPERPRFCAVLRDITQWKETEARLREARAEAERASTQKSDFLARVSHELRTPLNAIIGFAEVMVEERFGPIENQRYREYLRDIRASSEHVVSLINDLLDISRVEAGKLELDFAAVNVNDVARECVSLMQPQAGRRQVIIRSSLGPDLPPIVADARTLKQIFFNLLSNSVKYTDPGGQVIVSTRLEEDGGLVLRVRDNGGGMSEADLAKAMEPFRQVVVSGVGTGGGSGLGLPLTKALVEANRAEFTLRSARGEGTIAEVAFPSTRVLSE